jgi:hypothetical protein
MPQCTPNQHNNKGKIIFRGEIKTGVNFRNPHMWMIIKIMESNEVTWVKRGDKENEQRPRGLRH